MGYALSIYNAYTVWMYMWYSSAYRFVYIDRQLLLVCVRVIDRSCLCRCCNACKICIGCKIYVAHTPTSDQIGLTPSGSYVNWLLREGSRMRVRVYEFANGNGVRIVFGDHIVSAESGVPTAVRDYSSIKQAYAAENGRVRALLLSVVFDVQPVDIAALRASQRAA
jgi:hypothetical protein